MGTIKCAEAAAPPGPLSFDGLPFPKGAAQEAGFVDDARFKIHPHQFVA